MLKIFWYLLEISITGVVLLLPSALSAQELESKTFSPSALKHVPLLLAQDYGRDSSERLQLEQEGDTFFLQGRAAARDGAYEQAFQSFHQAAGYYWQCLGVETIAGRDRSRIEQKYRAAVAARDQVNRIR